MTSTYSEFELVQMYRQAKNKREQIPILCDMAVKSRREILDMLERNGITVKRRTSRGHKWTPEQEKKVQKLAVGIDKTKNINWTPKRVKLLRELIEEDGVPQAAVAKKIDRSTYMLHHTCVRYGIKVKKEETA